MTYGARKASPRVQTAGCSDGACRPLWACGYVINYIHSAVFKFLASPVLNLKLFPGFLPRALLSPPLCSYRGISRELPHFTYHGRTIISTSCASGKSIAFRQLAPLCA